MRGGLKNAWENARTSLWPVPSLFVLGAVALSSTLLLIDGRFLPDLADEVGWLFGGTADGAREILAVIAGSLITVISVAFSITILSLQLASQQYSPRILRNFTRDLRNQVVLGTYIATFVYSILVLRAVREATPTDEAFVPGISVTMAYVLAVVSLGMLVYFLHHISQTIQVSHLLMVVREELDEEIERHFPATFGVASSDPESPASLAERTMGERRGVELVVRADRDGYLRRIEEQELIDAASGTLRFAVVPVSVGSFITRGTVLLRGWSDERGASSEDCESSIRAAFPLDRNRSLEQDPLFGIRQIVDIAVKALSSGMNDATTAEECLDQLGGALTRLLERELPSPLREAEGVRFLFSRPGFEEYIEESFGQIRRNAAGQVHVTLHLLEVFERLAERVPSSERAVPLRDQAREILASASQSPQYSEHDRSRIVRRAAAVLSALERVERTEAAL